MPRGAATVRGLGLLRKEEQASGLDGGGASQTGIWGRCHAIEVSLDEPSQLSDPEYPALVHINAVEELHPARMGMSLSMCTFMPFGFVLLSVLRAWTATCNGVSCNALELKSNVKGVCPSNLTSNDSVHKTCG